jgi:hypothetical protein
MSPCRDAQGRRGKDDLVPGSHDHGKGAVVNVALRLQISSWFRARRQAAERLTAFDADPPN